MVGDKLHKFDCDLCDYIVGNIRQHLHGTAPGRNVADFSQWFTHQFTTRMPELGDYVWAGVFGETARLPLNDAELCALENATDDPPMWLEELCVWEPYPSLHRQYVECVPEIRSELTRRTAEDWAESSVNFATRLSSSSVSLTDGIHVVHEWLWVIRQLLRVMGATRLLPQPLGTHSTPTRPNCPARLDVRVSPIAVNELGARHRVPKAKSPETRDHTICGWREAMEITGVKKTKLYELFQRGILKGYRDGSMIRFYRTGLLGYMRERENNVAPPPRSVCRSKKGGTAVTRLKFL